MLSFCLVLRRYLNQVVCSIEKFSKHVLRQRQLNGLSVKERGTRHLSLEFCFADTERRQGVVP